MKTIVMILLVLIFFVAAMVFSASNTGMVSINYLIAQSDFNISAVIGVSFISGFLICWCIFYSLYIGLKLKLRVMTKKLVQSDKNNEKLKVKQLTNA
ncbi:MAG: DUF1049 domain-containing protein [Gammaproteobacteria bacterium]|nr:DUF1049 domain-containing protein [Gammaproteobacteria bacterium]